MFLHTTTIYLLCLALPLLAEPEGYYHQEYQYKQSSSSFKNNELQHKKDDEGFYTKDGDLTGTADPKVNEQHEHREFINPKLRAQGYTEQDFAGTGLDAQGRASQFMGGRGRGQALGATAAYNQNALLQSGGGAATLSSGMQSFMADLQADMQRKLESQLQQWRQDQEEYTAANARRYSSTSSGLYSPSTSSVDSIRRELQEEIRTNLTREMDLRNRVAQTNYDTTAMDDLKLQLQDNLMRQLNVLMQEQQDMLAHNAGSTAHSTAVKTKSSMNYSPTVPTSQYSSYEQDDLNRNQQYYQRQQRYHQPRPSLSSAVVPDQYVYTPSSSSSSRVATSSGSTYGSTMYGGSAAYENPTPAIKNVNQITEIAQQVQNDMQQILNKALDQYQHENGFNPSSKYQTKPDYSYARQNFESSLQYNLTEQFRTALDRNFGSQDLRGQYYFSRDAGNQRFANYRRDDYDRLKQQVTENLQKYLRDSLKTQEEYYESQQTAFSASRQSSASYTNTGGQRSVPYQEEYHGTRPSGYGAAGSRSYSSSSSYSGSAAYQTESRPQLTGGQYTKSYYPTGGYRTSSDTAAFGTYAKYQGRGDQALGSTGQVSAGMEDCDEGMQGDDPGAYNSFGVQARQSSQSDVGLYHRPTSYAGALRKPAASEELYQRPVSDTEDFGRVSSGLGNYQSVTRDLADYQRPLSDFYDSERPSYIGRLNQMHRYGLNKPTLGQFSVDSNDYDDDIRPGQKALNMEDENDVDIEIEASTKKNRANLFNYYKPTTEWIPSSTQANLEKAQIDELAQKLKDSVEDQNSNMNLQQKILDDDDDEQFHLGSPVSTSTTPKNFWENDDLVAVVRPQTHYKPYAVEAPSTTSKYDFDSAYWLPKPTPKYNYFNRQPLSSGFYERTTSTEAPKGAPEFQQHRLEDSYEDLRIHENPLYVKPKIGVHLERTNHRVSGLWNQNSLIRNVQKPNRYPEDDEFLENVLRQPKATNLNEEYDDLEQKPIDDNQEVLITSNRGDIDSISKLNVESKPLEDGRDLPIRLADISNVRGATPKPKLSQNNDDDLDYVQRPLDDLADFESNRHVPPRLSDLTRSQNDFDEDSDDVQRPIDDPIHLQTPVRSIEASPIRLTALSRPQYNPKPFVSEDRYADDLQRPLEGDFDDRQRPLEQDSYDEFGDQLRSRQYSRNSDQFVQNGRRLPDVYGSLTERPEVLENVVQKQEAKPLNGDYVIDEEKVVENTAPQAEVRPGFWKKVGGKISKTYSDAKQKARELAEKINFL